MTKQEYPLWFFVLLLLGMLYLFFRILSPFLMIFIWAVILVTTFSPVHQWLLSRLHGRQTLAAALMVLGLTVILILPITLALLIIARESVEAYNLISTKLDPAHLQTTQAFLNQPFVAEIKQFLPGFMKPESVDLRGAIDALLNSATSFLVDQSKNLFSSIAQFLFHFFLLLVCTYHLFRNGPRMLQEIRKLSPMDAEREEKIIDRFADVTRSTMKSIFANAVIQGILCGSGFWVVGLPSPLLWGTIMALCSLVPVVGTSLIWGPAAGYLLLTGHVSRGFILLFWCGLVVVLSENVLKPLIIRGKSNLHPVIIFFSILGGMSFFGFSGLILGPLITGLTFVFLEIYREEFREQLPGTVKLSREQIESAIRDRDMFS